MRRSFIAGLLALIGMGKTSATGMDKKFPPVPAWRPSFKQPLDRIADRISYYCDGKRDFVVFANGTCVILDDGLADTGAEAFVACP